MFNPFRRLRRARVDPRVPHPFKLVQQASMAAGRCGPLVACVLALAGCGFGQPEPTAFGGSVGPGMCTGAFEAANKRADQADRVALLEDAFRFCVADQWLLESRRFAAAVQGLDPVSFVTDRCSRRAFTNDLLCRDVAGRATRFGE